MKRLVLGLTAVLSLALAAVAFGAQAEYKVTGGGQTFATTAVGPDGKPTAKGPGDTITFNAFIQDDGDPESPATGSVNIIDRTAGAGGKGVHVKGVVQCAFVVPDSTDGRGYAELYGTATLKDGTMSDFVVRIQDNGQGSAAQNDLVEFDYETAETCGDNDDEETIETTLARGNAKIHKQNPSQSSAATSRSTSTRTTSILSLR